VVPRGNATSANLPRASQHASVRATRLPLVAETETRHAPGCARPTSTEAVRVVRSLSHREACLMLGRAAREGVVALAHADAEGSRWCPESRGALVGGGAPCVPSQIAYPLHLVLTTRSPCAQADVCSDAPMVVRQPWRGRTSPGSTPGAKRTITVLPR
jgi:hypothetical protein